MADHLHLSTEPYTDRGKPFVSGHAKIVCANLGIRLLHAKPYHAWSKGKVERLIRTIQGDFEASLRLPGQAAGSLDELHTALSRWIESVYHLRPHGSTGKSPHERFTAWPHPLRTLEDPGRIDPLFYTHTQRVVRKDATVLLGSVWRLVKAKCPWNLHFDDFTRFMEAIDELLDSLSRDNRCHLQSLLTENFQLFDIPKK